MTKSRVPPRRGTAPSTRWSAAWLVASGAALALAAPAAADGPRRTVAGMVYDLAIERPIGVVETAAGIGMMTIAMPAALAAGKTELVADRCVGMPGRYTFTRPIGDFREQPASNCSPLSLGWGLVGLSTGLIERPLGYLFGRGPFSDEDTGQKDEIEI